MTYEEFCTNLLLMGWHKHSIRQWKKGTYVVFIYRITSTDRPTPIINLYVNVGQSPVKHSSYQKVFKHIEDINDP